MRRIFDFQCDEGHNTERYIDSETRTINCPVCGKPAVRQIAAANFILEGVTGDFPGAAMRWDKRHSANRSN